GSTSTRAALPARGFFDAADGGCPREEHGARTASGEANGPPAADAQQLRSPLHDRRRRHTSLQAEVPVRGAAGRSLGSPARTLCVAHTARKRRKRIDWVIWAM